MLSACLDVVGEPATERWARRHLVAVGYSSARPVLDGDVEDRVRSRRVVFSVALDDAALLRDVEEGVQGRNDYRGAPGVSDTVCGIRAVPTLKASDGLRPLLHAIKPDGADTPVSEPIPGAIPRAPGPQTPSSILWLTLDRAGRVINSPAWDTSAPPNRGARRLDVAARRTCPNRDPAHERPTAHGRAA